MRSPCSSQVQRTVARGIRNMNAVEIDAVQKVDGFNFGHALELDPKFIELEYPFYWADVYELTHEFYDLRLHGVAFSKMKIVMLPLPEGTNALDDFRDEAISLFSEKPIRVPHGGRLRPGHKLFQLQPRGENSASRIETTRRIGSRPKLPRYQANVEYWGSSEVNPDQFHPRAICYFPSLVTFALPDRNIGVDATQARQHEFLRQKFTYVGASGSGRRTIGRRRTVDQEG